MNKDEIIAAGRKTSERAFKVYVAPDVSIDQTKRVVFDGDTYDVISIQPWPSEYIRIHIERITL